MNRRSALLIVAEVLCTALLSGCAVLRSNPLDGNRGAVVLVFDTRTAGDLKSLREVLSRYDARATVFVAGQITRGLAGRLYALRDDGHEIGLSGLRGVNPQAYCRTSGQQKYFQDEIVTQVLDARRFDLNPRYFLIGTLDSGKPNPVALTSFLVSKGLARVVHKQPDYVDPRDCPRSELTASVIHAYHLTEKNFDSARIAALAGKNRILVVTPDRKVLPALLAAARAADVPFATLADLPE